MKKVLLATTALTMSAGVAFAEVSISGYAEMGIVGESSTDATQFHQDIEVTFGMSTETDSGLTFGANIDLDETNVAAWDDSGTTVYMKGSFGNLTMGDTDGAFDFAMTETGMGTAMTDDHTSHAGYSGNSGHDGGYEGQVLRYDYSFGQAAVAVSLEMDDSGADGDNVIGLGGTYDAGVAKIGLGYQDDGTDAIMGLSVSGEASGFQYVANYSDLDSAGTHMGVGVGYTTGALMVHANYGVFETDAGVETDGFGAAVNYDLGGGAVVMAGYGSDVDGDADGTYDGDQFSFGLGLSF